MVCLFLMSLENSTDIYHPTKTYHPTYLWRGNAYVCQFHAPSSLLSYWSMRSPPPPSVSAKFTLESLVGDSNQRIIFTFFLFFSVSPSMQYLLDHSYLQFQLYFKQANCKANYIFRKIVLKIDLGKLTWERKEKKAFCKSLRNQSVDVPAAAIHLCTKLFIAMIY